MLWIGEKILTINPFVWALAVALGFVLSLQAASSARAQVTLDVSKITCDQYTGYKVTNHQNIAIWVSGYYHGKRGNTIADIQMIKENATKVRTYCIMNSNVTVMQAVETVLGNK